MYSDSPNPGIYYKKWHLYGKGTKERYVIFQGKRPLAQARTEDEAQRLIDDMSKKQVRE